MNTQDFAVQSHPLSIFCHELLSLVLHRSAFVQSHYVHLSLALLDETVLVELRTTDGDEEIELFLKVENTNLIPYIFAAFEFMETLEIAVKVHKNK